MVGVACVQITRIINGQQNPSAHLTYKILEVTKSAVTFEDLFNPNAPSRMAVGKKKENENTED